MSLSKPSADSSLFGAYMAELQANPIRTKSLTTGTLNALSELLASYLAGDKDPKTGSYSSSRVVKMGLYGFFVSAPMSHYLILGLQRPFRGRKGVFWKILQIIASNAIITPIQCSVFLIFMALIAGARTKDQIVATYKTGIMAILKTSWLTSPVALAIAQGFIPEHAWVPFFSLIAFVLGTYNNMLVKKKRQAQLQKTEKDK